MKILSIDTTRDELLVVLNCEGTLFIRSNTSGKKGHSSSLLPYIDEVMSEANIMPNELDAVAAVVGAGSFTGIRIGVATMNAIGFATGAKRISINSFELLSYNQNSKVLCTVPALHDNIFGALYDNGKEIEMGFYSKDELPNCENLIRQEDFDDFANALSSVAKIKFGKGEFVNQIRPLYLRKSQAERAIDEI
ncbi:MAG TPA: tRNA (adenosine(37)-N6)-threonylcarbamoyltransferase complex dimerization subunit type 1 TsaB [Clostridia bacterium]|nr:tRNA (adenosine(37)-N6)-threonylcarbamoyltransferase complex dimerization subunit type 1 TsaB [Clostridia bacterium]